MLLLPYKLDNEFVRVPVVTTLVALVCIITYLIQQYSWYIYQEDLRNFCHYEASETIKHSLREAECIELFARLDLANSPESELSFFHQTNRSNPISDQHIIQQLQRMRTIVDPALTVRLWYQPGSYDFLTMLTSKLGHLSWQQMLFNLSFFIAFALSAEQLLGHVGFFIYLVLGALCTSIIYSLAATELNLMTPGIGMTSIVSSVMMLVTINYSHKFLRMFFWLVFVSGTFRLPLVLISISYLGSDFYTITIKHGSDNLTYVNQVSGIIFGTLSGLIILAFRRFRTGSDTHQKQ